MMFTVSIRAEQPSNAIFSRAHSPYISDDRISVDRVIIPKWTGCKEWYRGILACAGDPVHL